MNIRGKTLSVIAFALLMTALANFFVLKLLVFPTFLELEQQAASNNIQRVIEAINAEVDDVDTMLWDYSSWDDSYKYATGGYDSYPEGNLAVETLQNLHLDIVEVYSAQKVNLFTTVYDREEGRVRPADWRLGRLGDNFPLLTLPQDTGKINGVVLTPDGPALVASRPIVRTNGEGPAAGVFLFGRFLDQELIARLKGRIKVDFALTLVDALSASEGGAVEQLLQDGKLQLVEASDDDYLTAYSLIRDFAGKPLLLASAKVRRDISQTGQQVLIASVGGLALTAILVMAALAILLQWVLVGPLVSLTQHVVEIGTDGALNRPIGLRRRDEIGILAREFDRMLASLADARRRLLDHSYQSGIAHMASGVLHNLRNQLMPAMTRAERLHEQVTMPTATKLDTALEQFASEHTPAERKARIASYIALSLQHMRDQQDGIASGLSAISQDLVHIEEVLGDLDRFSRAGSKIEPVSLASCITETIAMVPSFPDVTVAIQVDPEVEQLPPVASENFVLKHVLQNLVINAIEAIIAAGKTAGTISIKGSPLVLNGEKFINLAIKDNGIGIIRDNLSTIFNRGFSTKKKDQRGAGLHWCANSVGAMFGKIFAESPGHNQGATLHVLLKVA